MFSKAQPAASPVASRNSVARSSSLLEDHSFGMAGARSITAKISTDAPTASTTEAPVCARTDSDAVIVSNNMTNATRSPVVIWPRTTNSPP